MPRPTLDEYREKLRGLSNVDLVRETGQAILGAAVMARMRSNDGWDDDRADACYDEAVRRDNVDLYQRAYNSVVREQGHHGLASEVTTPLDVGDPALTPASQDSRQQQEAE